ncbi:hypothetical protein GGX14DRAFT_319592, partial [Mycena pura]
LAGDKTLQKEREDSGSEEKDAVPNVEVDASTLTALSPEAISKQASQGCYVALTICRTIGRVAHGKSTVV